MECTVHCVTTYVLYIIFLKQFNLGILCNPKLLKGTVPRDFSPPVFFVKELLLVPIGMLRNDLEFFRIFVEKFEKFGASPVSMTPAKQALPVSLTPVRISSPVSTTPVSDAFTVL